MIDNVTWVRGRHGFKAGFDAQFVGDDRVRGERFDIRSQRSTSISRVAGTNPLGYTTFRQDFGNLTASYSSAFYGLFVQDDWQLTDRVKVLSASASICSTFPRRGLRAEPVLAGLHHRQEQLGPRAGVSWSLDSQARTVLRRRPA